MTAFHGGAAGGWMILFRHGRPLVLAVAIAAIVGCGGQEMSRSTPATVPDGAVMDANGAGGAMACAPPLTAGCPRDSGDAAPDGGGNGGSSIVDGGGGAVGNADGGGASAEAGNGGAGGGVAGGSGAGAGGVVAGAGGGVAGADAGAGGGASGTSDASVEIGGDAAGGGPGTGGTDGAGDASGGDAGAATGGQGGMTDAGGAMAVGKFCNNLSKGGSNVVLTLSIGAVNPVRLSANSGTCSVPMSTPCAQIPIGATVPIILLDGTTTIAQAVAEIVDGDQWVFISTLTAGAPSITGGTLNTGTCSAFPFP